MIARVAITDAGRKHPCRARGGGRMKWLFEYFGLFGLLAAGFVVLGAAALLLLRML
jgi:hypothetical protein